MLKFIGHDYGFKIVSDMDGTIGNITYYNDFILIGGIFRDYEIKKIIEEFENVIHSLHVNKPITIKYLPSLIYSRASQYRTNPIILLNNSLETLKEKFKNAQKPTEYKRQYTNQILS